MAAPAPEQVPAELNAPAAAPAVPEAPADTATAAEADTAEAIAVDVPQANEAAEEPATENKRQKDEPVKIGFKTFQTADAALKYFYDLVKCLRREQDINEYEHTMVHDLLERGHPAGAQKIGCGVRAFQILKHSEIDSECFFVIRTDGTKEDFSIRKSIAGLFPVWASTNETKSGPSPARGRGRGRGRGGRDSGRGSRGGGRGFRSRGRGRRGRGR